MKKITISIISIFLIVSCQSPKTPKKENKEIESNQSLENVSNEIVGTFEYVYPDNTEDLIENHYIVIEKKDSLFYGRYYGTSDEFDESREGYYPGFFVAEMENLEIINDTISFTLNVPNEKILSKAVDLKIKTFEEAIKNGYENWANRMKLEPKDYVGIIENQKTIFFKGEYEFQNKRFTKK